MSRISIVIFLIALLSTVKAFSGQKNCFVEHLKEAIEVNQQRTSIYSRASDGESYWLSRHLIHFEKLILPLAKVYDRRARVYQRAGIALFCRDFVSMEGIPTIDHIPSQIPDTPIIRPKTQAAQTKKLIYKTLRKKGIAAVTELLRIKVK
ncbi:MAG: hypothetical protein HOM21_09755, partial [Halobacteriovoraceae bacterium]|nr:hypothetical protein [Halobacteriovoraceae bacterium]